ncbi:ATPase-like, ParA/MinD [Rhodothermus marinus SG0.5JP17-172]|jgi:ATP-binding protein involved in chromosome partitioning|uniref:Mrp/NBP35 family ATP-binding protein n=1 Tax=Rhodothermus marinus TaxID=29549 RepID=UPI000223D875|nr:Mrp/NBP35 family ATP-binding protein [Rhodothermus marinus]AEN74217.1 ATPase-like, ParA/MinD [Rhodothermus marinus SG0.5JP17-172]MBO2490801.1 MRP family ATP-binding protein [Rhodothermus marinus]
MPTPQEVLRVLARVVEPERGRDIVRLKMVRNLRVEDGRVSFTLVFNRPDTDFARQAPEQCRKLLQEAFGPELSVQIDTDAEMIGLEVQGGGPMPSVQPEGVLNFIAVASGKGGVGKSTVAVNLAVALAQQGYDVGLLDADIYGPSVPTMFGVRDEKPRVNEQRKIVPLVRHNVRLLSMGFIVDPEQAVIWRGPMVAKALRQFLGEADWGELDFLILDLPPGTGDVPLTIVQSIALTGAVIVSTPQPVALADARKGVAMFRNVQVPVLGIVENMAYFSPPDLPDRKYYIFGRGGAWRLAEELDVPFLGEIPIEEAVREGGDLGKPVVLAEPESASAKAFFRLAEQVVEQVNLRNAEQPPTQRVEILYR